MLQHKSQTAKGALLKTVSMVFVMVFAIVFIAPKAVQALTYQELEDFSRSQGQVLAVSISSLPAPTNLQASAVSCGRVDLTWNAPTDTTGLTSYTVYRNGTYLGNVIVQPGDEALPGKFTDWKVTGGTTNTYTVTSENSSSLTSPHSTAVTASAPLCAGAGSVPPTTPTLISATASQICGQVNLSWTAATSNSGAGIKLYKIWRDGILVKTLSSISTTYTDITATPIKAYSYTVSAVDFSGGASGQSTPKTVPVPVCAAQAPAAPTQLKAFLLSGNQVFLTWGLSETSNASTPNYQVFRNGQLIATTDNNTKFLQNSYLDTSTTSLSGASYRVTAVNVGGTSAQSAVVTPFVPTNNDYLAEMARVAYKHIRLSAGNSESPTFKSNNDWHSSVEAFWAILKAARTTGQLSAEAEYVNQALDPVLLKLEDDYLANKKEFGSVYPLFEMPYGRAWFLKLAAEFEQWAKQTNQPDPQRLRPLAEKLASTILATYQQSGSVQIDAQEYYNPSWALAQLRMYYAYTGDTAKLSSVDQIINTSLVNGNSATTFAADKTSVYFMSIFGSRTYAIAKSASGQGLDSFLQSHPVTDADIAPFDTTDMRTMGNLWSRAWTLKAMSEMTALAADKARFLSAYNSHVQLLLQKHWANADIGFYSHWLPMFAMQALTDVTSPSGGSGITFVDASTHVSTTSTNPTLLTIAKPVGVKPGDLMLAYMVVTGTKDPSAVTPSGWQLLRAMPSQSIYNWMGLYYKYATANEPSSYTWNMNFTLGHIASIQAYRGVSQDPNTVFNAQSYSENGSSAPSVTTTVDNAMVVGLFSIDWPQINMPPPQDMSLRWMVTSQDNSGMSVDFVKATAGATGVKNFIPTCYPQPCTAPTGGFSSLIALSPAGVTPSDTTPPTVPTKLAVTVISDTNLVLQWDKSNDGVGVTGYKVFRNNVQAANITTGEILDDKNLSPATTYTYTVQAYDAAGNLSPISAPVTSATVPALDPNMQVVQSKWATLLNPGEDGIRDLVYAGGFLWALIPSSPAQLVKIDPNNPNNRQTLTFANDGKHNLGLQLTYVVSQNKLYAFFKGNVQIYVSQIDLNNLSVVDVINDPAYTGTNGAITNDGTHLYLTTFGTVARQDTGLNEYAQVIKYRLSDFSRVGAVSLGTYSGWAITVDGNKIYVAGDNHSNGPAWVARVSTDMVLEQFVESSIVNSEAGHRILVDGEYAWAAIRPGKFLRLQKTNLANKTELQTDVAGWTRAGVTKAGGYMWSCNDYNPSILMRIDPVTLAKKLYQFPVGYGLTCIAIETDSQNLYVAFGSVPGKVMAITLSSLLGTVPIDTILPVVTITSPANGATVSGTFTVMANATDNVGVTKVEFSVDNALQATANASPFSFYWDTTKVSNSGHAVSAKAIDAAGNTSSSAVYVTVSNITDIFPPSVPTNLTASASSTQVSLSWSASTDNVAVAGYKVYRWGVHVGTATSTTFIDTGLAPYTQYSYNVTAFDAAGNNSLYSNQALVTTQSAAASPVISSAATATATVGLPFTYQITATNNPTSYSATGLPTGLSVNAATGLISGSPTFSSTYPVTITATNSGGSGSAVLTITVVQIPSDTQVPTVPANLTAQLSSSNQPVLSWSASTDNVGVTGYRVYRNGNLLLSLSNTSFTDNSTAAGTTYSYTVAAYDAAGNTSAQSLAVSITTSVPTTPLSVTSKSITNKTANTATVIWNTNIPSTGTVYYGTSSSNLTLTSPDGFVGTSHVINLSGLNPGTRYYYKIVAVSQDGKQTVTSSIANFRTSRK